LSKSKHHNKNIFDEYEEEVHPRVKKIAVDKRKERRIVRALKTKNVHEYLQYDENNLLPEEDIDAHIQFQE
jgi:hypothetical protein